MEERDEIVRDAKDMEREEAEESLRHWEEDGKIIKKLMKNETIMEIAEDIQEKLGKLVDLIKSDPMDQLGK